MSPINPKYDNKDLQRFTQNVLKFKTCRTYVLNFRTICVNLTKLVIVFWINWWWNILIWQITTCNTSSGQKWKWYFVTKIVLTYCEKNCSSNWDFLFEIRGWRLRICKHFEITKTIFSNSERSEHFLVTECFFNLFLEVSHI